MFSMLQKLEEFKEIVHMVIAPSQNIVSKKRDKVLKIFIYATTVKQLNIATLTSL